MWGVFGRSKKEASRKDELVKLHDNLHYSFSRVDRDITHVGQWINHLHEKHNNLEKSHSSHVELTRKELESVARWIKFLHDHSVDLQKNLVAVENLAKGESQRNADLKKKVDFLESEVESIKGHLRTQQGTSTGQVQDKSHDIHLKKIVPSVEDHPLLIVPEERESASHVMINKSALNGAQLELLRILYEADRPLSYGDLAKILNKKGKSIRNLIYEIREKGVNIESRFVGLKKKGFYLTREQKIKVSGR